MATIPGLRPLRLGEILDVGIKIYLRHWRTLIGCVVLVVLPVQVLSTLVTLSIAPEQLDFTEANGRAGVDSDELGAYIGAQVVVGILQGLVLLLATAACFKAVSDAYLGGEPDARRSLAFALRRLPSLILLGILGWLGLLVALIALVIPAIWLSVAWSLAIPALLFEGVSPAGALGRSFRLVKGRWWKICGTLLVGVVLVSFLSGVLEGILLAVPALFAEGNDAAAALANVVAGTIGSVLTTPFTAAVIALLYYDQRVRKEGFDLQLLAAGLGAEGASDDVRPPPAPSLVPATPTEAERAAAPYWPPPPGWKPPAAEEPGREEPAGESAPAEGLWAKPRAGSTEGESVQDGGAPPDAERDEPPPAAGEWQPPQSPRWPSEPPPRGPAGV